MAGLLDGVVLNCATTGTTSPLALGTAAAPYLGMAAAGAVSGNTYSYSIVDSTNGASEYGTGQWNAGAGNGTLGRNPLWSTNGGGPINCSGTQLVRITALMEDLLPSAQLGPEFVMLNGTLTHSLASNNLTVAVKTSAGNDPSAGDPVVFVFGTLASTYNVIRVTAPLNFTINAGNTLGTANGVPFRLWIVAINNGGTVLLGAFQSVTGGATPTAITPLVENDHQSTGPGTNGGSSAGVIYTSSPSLSLVPIRIIGFMDWNGGLTTAGTWNTTPNLRKLFGPGVKKPGDLVQTAFLTTNVQTTTTLSSLSATALSKSITPTSQVNLVRSRFGGSIGVSKNGDAAVWAVFRNGVPSPQQCRMTVNGSTLTDIEMPLFIEFLDAPATNVPTTYALAFRTNVGATSTVSFPSTNGDTASMTLEEIMA
jgi:hypothetical protein